MILRRAPILLCLGLLLAAVGACGKRGDPTLPPGVADNYPRGYPEGARSPSENIFDTIRPGRR